MWICIKAPAVENYVRQRYHYGRRGVFILSALRLYEFFTLGKTEFLVGVKYTMKYSLAMRLMCAAAPLQSNARRDVCG
jgi:hypothetical protein